MYDIDTRVNAAMVLLESIALTPGLKDIPEFQEAMYWSNLAALKVAVNDDPTPCKVEWIRAITDLYKRINEW